MATSKSMPPAGFLTVTGAHLPGTPDRICAADLEPLTALFPQLNGGIHEPARTCQLANFPPAEAMPAGLVAGLARTHPQLRRVLDSSYPSESERDVALVRFAKCAGWPPESAWSLVLGVRTDGKACRPDYQARTLALVGY